MNCAAAWFVICASIMRGEGVAAIATALVAVA